MAVMIIRKKILCSIYTVLKYYNSYIIKLSIKYYLILYITEYVLHNNVFRFIWTSIYPNNNNTSMLGTFCMTLRITWTTYISLLRDNITCCWQPHIIKATCNYEDDNP